MPDEVDYLPFEAFRARVGASSQRVRAALLALRLTPVRLLGDARRTGYDPAWVDAVTAWLKQHTER
jgi:hypothetical protein